jgi:hypothetical protein
MTTPEPQGTRPLAIAPMSIDVIVRARRLARLGLLATLVLPFPLGWVLQGVVAVGAFTTVAFGVFAAAAFVALVLSFLPRWRSVGLGTLSIEGNEMIVRREEGARGLPASRRFPIRSIVAGYRTDQEVRLRTKRGELVSIAFQRPEEGEAILRAVGHDAHQRVLEVPLASLASRFLMVTPFVWSLVALSIPGTLASPLLLAFAVDDLLVRHGHVGDGIVALVWVLIQIGLVASCVRLLRRRAVTVGTDGISFRRFLLTRFYPYSAVAAVELAPAGVSIALRSGRRVSLRTRAGWRPGAPDEHARALLERIGTAQRAAASAVDMHAKIQLLERRGRSLAGWREHLSTLVGKAGYRTGAVTSAELSAVIADPSLPAEHRVAAAVALTVAEPAEASARIRIAAAASADQDLRDALVHAAEGEIDEARLDRLRVR